MNTSSMIVCIRLMKANNYALQIYSLIWSFDDLTQFRQAKIWSLALSTHLGGYDLMPHLDPVPIEIDGMTVYADKGVPEELNVDLAEEEILGFHAKQLLSAVSEQFCKFMRSGKPLPRKVLSYEKYGLLREAMIKYGFIEIFTMALDQADSSDNDVKYLRKLCDCFSLQDNLTPIVKEQCLESLLKGYQWSRFDYGSRWLLQLGYITQQEYNLLVIKYLKNLLSHEDPRAHFYELINYRAGNGVNQLNDTYCEDKMRWDAMQRQYGYQKPQWQYLKPSVKDALSQLDFTFFRVFFPLKYMRGKPDHWRVTVLVAVQVYFIEDRGMNREFVMSFGQKGK
ncbi:hypothetical protein MP228_012618 [Amoeboaphelidium protococcarum]|nr:hypothetical protein MP228_012618 [Amoeboaphelidium protococcarum]